MQRCRVKDMECVCVCVCVNHKEYAVYPYAAATSRANYRFVQNMPSVAYNRLTVGVRGLDFRFFFIVGSNHHEHKHVKLEERHLVSSSIYGWAIP